MSRAPVGAALALALLGSPALAADPFSSDWARAAKSQARLIAGGGDLAGFEVALAPGADEKREPEPVVLKNSSKRQSAC